MNPNPAPITVHPLVEFFAAATHAGFGLGALALALMVGPFGFTATVNILGENLISGALAGLSTVTGFGLAAIAGLHSLVAAAAWLRHAATPGPLTLSQAVYHQAWTLRWILGAGCGGIGGTVALLAWFLVNK